jgi:hypothetical protein
MINAISKLSKLQKQILLLALDSGSEIIKTDALLKLFGSPSPGTPKYSSAHASISRATRRLADRGLVSLWCSQIRSWTGISLTPSGKLEAQNLKTVK